MNCSTPGIPVHHQLPEFTQTHIHGVGDAIQPSHPLLSPLLLLPPIPPSIRVFSNESTLRMGGQSTGVSALASFLPKKSQGWSPSEWTGWTIPLPCFIYFIALMKLFFTTPLECPVHEGSSYFQSMFIEFVHQLTSKYWVPTMCQALWYILGIIHFNLETWCCNNCPPH